MESRQALSTLAQLYGVFRAGREEKDQAAIAQEQAVLKAISTRVVAREEQAKDTADKAMGEFDKVIAQHKPWWQRMVGR